MCFILLEFTQKVRKTIKYIKEREKKRNTYIHNKVQLIDVVVIAKTLILQSKKFNKKSNKTE